MAKQHNAAIVRGLYEKFGQGDIDGLVGSMSQDVKRLIPIAEVSLSVRREGPGGETAPPRYLVPIGRRDRTQRQSLRPK